MSTENLVEAFPLYWPLDWPRTPAARREASPFKMGFGRSRDDLLHALRLFGAKAVVLSTDVPLRLDGLPYANTREPGDPGVAVYFTHGKLPRVIACDSYRTVAGNIRACWATIEALRTVQRHGASQLLDRAFVGFKALPSQGTPSKPEDWWQVLQVDRDATPEEVKAHFRTLALEAHPDRGGSDAAMTRLNVAFDAFRRERGIT